MRVSITHLNWINRNKYISKIADAAKKHARGKLLDIGCGTKPYLELFSPFVNEYIGLDIPPTKDIIRNPSIIKEREKDVDIYGSVLDIPSKNNEYDTVASFQVLEHVADPFKMFKEISRVLKKNGILILTAPQMWNLHEAPHDYFRYTKYGLTYLCKQSQLKVISIEPLGGFWARTGLKISYLLESFGRRNIILSKVILFIRIFTNSIFWLMDKTFSTPNDPINHLLVAKKI